VEHFRVTREDCDVSSPQVRLGVVHDMELGS
jgi:hypothetical protein